MPVVAALTVTSHASDAMVAIPFWLEMFAVVAASISGVLVARAHKLDLVGAVALAVVCGLGGGLLRDMTLQVGNVYILNQPVALPLSIATAAIIYIFPAIVDKPEKLIPLLDIISVGIYAATGADKALVYGKLCMPRHERTRQQHQRPHRVRRGDHGSALAVAAF